MASADSKQPRELDVVVFGATGFTGRLVSEYLHARYGGGKELRWGIAGRSRDKLERLRDELDGGDSMPLFVADSRDSEALDDLTRRTRVVLSTVGPYAKYGSPLVEACVRNATDYCDLAGEVQWMRQMIDTHGDVAAASGARIVHACGFDSVPSDIGVWFLQKEARSRFGEPLSEVTLLVRAMRGGFSGGTAASLLNVIEETRKDRQLARQLADPYTLNPEGLRNGPDERDQTGPAYSEHFGVWTSPFVMAVINQRIVRRSNALLDFAYGRDFRYREAVTAGPGTSGRLKALAATAGLGGFMLASSNELLREHVVRRLLPDPGTGPDAAARERGFFNLLIGGTTTDGQALTARVTGDRDPGYGSTSRMIAESAVCLAKDELAVGGGFWTPAAAMGDPLLARLEENAGLTFEILERDVT
ncbi:MAG: saccharopine dehydrogenase NADP-binding domain-containing protein [Woeseiaceae bacterium]|nr:saccharopine dehydrogenase NADP-binding domain-containing protein [Woeseiaceae bacterium]